MNSAPAVIKSSVLGDSDISYYISDFEQAFLADNFDRIRGIRNMQGYTSYNYGQYDKSEKRELADEGRTPSAYNLIQMIVRGHTGNMMMNWFDPKFIQRQPGMGTLIGCTQDLWYAQKEHYNYKHSSLKCIENGLIYRGIEEIVIDKPTPNPRTWGIKYESIRPDLVIFDPDNVCDRISRTSRKAWKVFYLTPKQAIQLMPSMEDQIRDKLRNNARAELGKPGESKPESTEYEYSDIDVFIDLSYKTKLGTKYQFVQKYEMENELVTRQFLKDSAVEIPQTGYKFGSKEDVMAKQLWASQRGIELTTDGIITLDQYESVLYTRIWSKDLGIVLENKKDSRQLGHLPLYCWSFLEKNGKSIGVVDVVWDSQQDFTQREMAKTKILTSSPISGKPYIHEMLFNGDAGRIEKEANEFNDSSKVMQIPEDVPPQLISALVGIIPGTQVNPAIFQDEGFKVDLINRIGSLNLAMQGQTERSGESGLLLSRKVIEGSVMNRLPTEAYIQHENDKAEDWLRLAPKVFGGEHNYNRRMMAADGREVILNELVGIDENGDPIVNNDISKLSRVEVVITQTKENDYIRQANREMNIGALQAMQPTQLNAGLLATLQCRVVRSNDYTDDEEKAQVDKMCDQTLRMAELQNELTIKTLESQIASMNQPQPGMPPGSPQGAPGTPPGAPAGEPDVELPNLNQRSPAPTIGAAA